MTGAELRRRRESIPATVESLAEILGEPAERISLWEETSRLPGSLVRRIEWALAFESQQLALVQAGHPPCPTAEAFFVPPAANPDAYSKQVDRAQAHADTCPACTGRKEYLTTLPPLPPPPLSFTVRTIVAVSESIGRLPRWLRPAAWGALVLGSMVLLRVLFMIVIMPGRLSLQTLPSVLLAIGVGAYGGLIGGLAYSAVRPRTLGWGKKGQYLTGIVCAIACFFAFAIPATIFTPDPILRSTAFWGFGLAVAAVVGVFAARSFFPAAATTDA